jgi:hypothetical protein
MRKRPQLREILPIYPAMPFPPLARFDRRSTIRAKETGPNDHAALIGTHSRENLAREAMKWSGIAVRTAGIWSAAAPQFHWHCRREGKGPDHARNGGKGNVRSFFFSGFLFSSADFFCEFAKCQFGELQSDCPAVRQFSVVGDTGRSWRRDTFFSGQWLVAREEALRINGFRRRSSSFFTNH